MVEALGAEEPDRIRLYTARHEGTLVAATIAIRVGAHAWYSYGASSTEKREVRGSNAVQWQMIRDAIAAGADVYDLRGITDTLADDDPHLGLIQFKVGTGGEAVEYVGEWDLPLNKALYTAFDLYMKRARHEPHPHRRRRPLARPPARRSPTAEPGLVPVAKGNGYGFTLGRLARKAQWLTTRASASTPSRSAPTRSCPRSPAGTTAACWCSPPGARSAPALERRPGAAPAGSSTPSAGPRTSPTCWRASPTPAFVLERTDQHAAPRDDRPRAVVDRRGRPRAPEGPGRRASPCTCRSPTAPTSPRCTG